MRVWATETAVSSPLDDSIFFKGKLPGIKGESCYLLIFERKTLIYLLPVHFQALAFTSILEYSGAFQIGVLYITVINLIKT